MNEKSKVDPSDAVLSVHSATVAYWYFVTVTLWELGMENGIESCNIYTSSSMSYDKDIQIQIYTSGRITHF